MKSFTAAVDVFGCQQPHEVVDRHYKPCPAGPVNDSTCRDEFRLQAVKILVAVRLLPINTATRTSGFGRTSTINRRPAVTVRSPLRRAPAQPALPNERRSQVKSRRSRTIRFHTRVPPPAV